MLGKFLRNVMCTEVERRYMGASTKFGHDNKIRFIAGGQRHDVLLVATRCPTRLAWMFRISNRLSGGWRTLYSVDDLIIGETRTYRMTWNVMVKVWSMRGVNSADLGQQIISSFGDTAKSA